MIIPTDTHLRKRAIADAAARKRLLHTRFLTWASGTATTGGGVIGPAGESVVHVALTAAAPYGYRLINPASGQVRSLFGNPVPSGPLDNGALLTTVDGQTGLPSGQFVVLVKVKNVRSWIYPGAAELHQLLDKSATLQLANLAHRFVPVLVRRTAHYTTNVMAEHLGFYVISTKQQFVPALLRGTAELDEVINELAYDLTPHPEAPPPALVKHFTTTLQGVATRTAERWRVSAEFLGGHFASLRDDGLQAAERAAALHDLRQEASEFHGEPSRSW